MFEKEEDKKVNKIVPFKVQWFLNHNPVPVSSSSPHLLYFYSVVVSLRNLMSKMVILFCLLDCELGTNVNKNISQIQMRFPLSINRWLGSWKAENIMKQLGKKFPVWTVLFSMSCFKDSCCKDRIVPSSVNVLQDGHPRPWTTDHCVFDRSVGSPLVPVWVMTRMRTKTVRRKGSCFTVVVSVGVLWKKEGFSLDHSSCFIVGLRVCKKCSR